ncbi:MBL fold metallo-hydrolase [Shouchella sp. JSM 1781072]|uniref:MBL fold metallo-hydrolase n=1 Tax=Bacillaceae TaxID=186817 RepID=UPI0020D12E98|nr:MULTISPECIES: MBL fold metallo-hydrolase [Bacillaceae]UTR05873.1 MBL fold metallo-hydrolase [Alkalihalobacillus sp. LMS6]
MFKKTVTEHSTHNVHMANGKIKFRNVQLNTISFATDGIIIDAASASLHSLFAPFWQKHATDALYCTHIHEDHTGCANWFQQTRKVPVFLNNRSHKEAHQPGSYPIYRRLYWGNRKPFRPHPMPAQFQSRTSSWKSIYTPGHSYDHSALLNETTGQLFSGDLYVQTKTKVMMRSESIPEIIRSLEHVLQYEFDDVFCCHAGHLPKGKKQLQNKLDYLYELTDLVNSLHMQGKPVRDIQKTLFPRKYPITLFSFGQWNSKHIITSILKEPSR